MRDAERALYELANSRYDIVVVDIETDYDKDKAYEHPQHYRLLCVGLCYARGKAIVISEESLQDPGVRFALALVLRTKRIVAHNGKFDLQGLVQIQPEAKLAADTLLMSYAADERTGPLHGLKYLAKEILGAPDYEKEVVGFRTFADAATSDLWHYNACDVQATWLLMEHFDATLDADSKRLHTFLVRASNALTPTEFEGVGVDYEYLQATKADCEAQLEGLEKHLFEYVDNPRSPKQVSAALKALGVPYVASTDRDHLIWHLENKYAKPALHEFCRLMLEHRKLSKLLGTYLAGMERRLFAGRLYPTYLLHGTVTGRLSARNPNLQNIPRGAAIKRMFIPLPGNVFVYGDYSQLEARIVATLAEEPYLREVFSDPSRDLFWELARGAFGPNATKDHRQIMKRVSHGSNYGMGLSMMAAQVNSDAANFGVTVNFDEDDAKRVQRAYFRQAPKIKSWQQATKSEVFLEGADLTTPYGRKRRIYLITDDNRKDIENETLAFRPQSIASDINLTAFCKLRELGLQTRLPVHDSLIVECPREDADDVAKLMEEKMTEAGQEFSDYVPFAVEIKVGETWGDF